MLINSVAIAFAICYEGVDTVELVVDMGKGRV